MHYYINDATQRVVPTSMSFSDVHKLYDTQAEAEAVLTSLPYLASLMDQVGDAKMVMIDRKQYKRTAELLECLNQIHAEMSKGEWDSDTSSNVSELLCAFGMPVKDSDEEPGEALTEIQHNGERWAFNDHSVCCWDDELGFEFRFYHHQHSPTKESILAVLKDINPELPA